MSHIFLSYSNEDLERARELARALSSDGFDVWWDQRIETGADFAHTIREKLTGSAAVVVLWSHASTRSKWVRAEAQLADEHDRLCPAMIESVDLPLPFNRLETALIQGWKGARDHAEYQQLVSSLKRYTGNGDGSVAMTLDEGFAIRPDARRDEAPVLESSKSELASTIEILSSFSARLGARSTSDEVLVALSGFASNLSQALTDFPEHALELRDFLFDWHSSAESWVAANPSDGARRILDENRRALRGALDAASAKGLVDDLDWPKPLPWLIDVGSWSVEVARKRLMTQDELVRLDAADGLARQPLESMQRFVSSLTHLEERQRVHAAIWEAWPRLRRLHPKSHATLAQLLARQEPEMWQRRLATFEMMKGMKSADEVDLILGRATGEDRVVFFETLLDHNSLACREFALDQLPAEKRWTTVLHPSTHIVVVREITARSVQDCEPDYVKALFLLLLPRLNRETSTIGIREAYRILCLFADVPLFLQDTFFEKLLGLRNALRRKIEQQTALQHLEEESQEFFQSFLSQGRLKDVDITRMTHIPPPIQRLLAHEGHFPKFFICNYRDVVALETIPHVQRRPDFVDFLKLKRINGNALEELVSDRLIMREYVNKLTYCRHPKAKTKQLMEHLRVLRRTDLRALGRDKNASTFAREQATRMMNRSV